jgi:hypothetical protein
MDPITILAACTAVWNGIKKASEFAQEAEGVWSQLSKYAGLADQLEQHITTAKNKPQKPKLFGNLEFGNDTQEAFNVFEAEHKLMQMEAEIKHEFIYGAFADLEGGYGSLDGYRKFLEMRRKIRADRIRMKQEQEICKRSSGTTCFFMVAVQPSWWLGACFCTWQLTLFLGTQNDSLSRNSFDW